MANRDEVNKFTEIQLQDAHFKISLYLQKINDDADPHSKKEKLCHLAAQTSLKFAENDKFAHENIDNLKIQLNQRRNYYILYLMDILLKNHRIYNKLVRKQLEPGFKAVWEKVQTEPKNSIKLQNLKAMARTWGVIYGEKVQQNLKKWLAQKFDTNLKLQEKNQELFKQSYEKQKNARENKEPKMKDAEKQLLDALKDE